MFLPVTAHGIGAALPGHQTADLVGSGVFGGRIPRWVGPAWYVMPIGAAIAMALLGVMARRATVVRMLVATFACVSATGFVVYATDLDWSRLGAGAWCALAGAVLALGSNGIELATARRGRGGCGGL